MNNCDCDDFGMCGPCEDEHERKATIAYCQDNCDEDDPDCPPHESEDCVCEHGPVGVHAA